MKSFLKPLSVFILMISVISINAGLQALDRTVVVDKASDVSPLLIGEKIPELTLFSSDGKPLNLLKEAKKQPTILLFYRGGWCPFCNAQLSQLQMVEKDISKLGYQLIAISPDTPDALKETSKGRELSYKLASDFNFEATRNFGLGFYIPKTYSDKVASIGGEVHGLKGDSRSILPVPAVFVLDQEGVIKFQYVNPNYAVRIEPELLLTAAKLALTK